MKALRKEIEEIKKSDNIERYHFEEDEIFYEGKWITGKILYFSILTTKNPTLFPFGESDRQLFYYIAKLYHMKWEPVQIDKYSYQYIIKIIPKQDELTQVSVGIGVQTCSDCKDGYYYPLVGPRELCKTCIYYS